MPIRPLAVLFAASALAGAQPFDGVVDSAASDAALDTQTALTTAGSLLGDYDATANPTGTQTRPGLFGGSGNQPIPASADFTSTGALASHPAGTLTALPDFNAGTIDFDALTIDLLNGAPGTTDLAVTLLYDSFHTVSPSFIYPGGIPLTLPLGQLASISRAELTQTGPGLGTLTPTATPDLYDFTAVVPASAALTVLIAPPGGEPLETDLDAIPLALPLAGQLERLSDSSIRLTVTVSPDPIVQTVPIDALSLPAIPLELPTLGADTASVALTLSPDTLTFDAALSLSLVINATAPACPADLAPPAGVLNFFDISAYITLYNTADPAADLAAPFGTLNFFDVAAYIGLYNAGCP